jgi:hypothetical protein
MTSAALKFGLAAGAIALVAPYAYDQLAPIPPLPDLAQHNAAWNAAWTSIYQSNVLGTQRRRAVTLTELANEQASQILGRADLSHEDEAQWIEAWQAAWKAGDNASDSIFGLCGGAGTKYDGTAFDPLLCSGVESAAGSDSPITNVPLSPVGSAYVALMQQWRTISCWGTALGIPCHGDPASSTRHHTADCIRTLAAAMDAAVEDAGALATVAHKLGAGAGWVAAEIGDALGSILGGAIGGVAGAVAASLVPIAAIGVGGYIAYRVVKR